MTKIRAETTKDCLLIVIRRCYDSCEQCYSRGGKQKTTGLMRDLHRGIT
jgi:hypothetical protein